MTKAERMEDIKNRYSLALAERNFTEQGTENYNTLSEVAKMILSEFPAVAKSRSSGKVNRYGFRLYGRNYKLVTLANSQRI